MNNLLLVLAAINGFVAVSLGAFAAHGLKSMLGPDLLATFQTGVQYHMYHALAMLAVGSAVGGVMAFAFYAMTVISLPLLVERKVDFLTAIIASLATVRRNFAVMIGWAAVIAGILFVAMLPGFLGLLVALPVLGHATWHLYERAVH